MQSNQAQIARIAKLHDEADDDVLIAIRVKEKVVVANDPIVVAAQQHLDLLQRCIRRAHVLAWAPLHDKLLAHFGLPDLLNDERCGKSASPEL